ncbi:SulP family inorganic anion transporter [Staphylococcus caeli]|uniref:Sulfate permease n=1 Tax=Staphylococcus caeli TaxID=2201815 RepID=A0A1D4KY58_9STAP|nr:SulP family inorganic anion transporter [Staphylococcus caeli]SCS69854.1 sulfate permease [Staphylococcus caeli]SCS78723.1 sulfate permease [Staphylococcus caeli]
MEVTWDVRHSTYVKQWQGQYASNILAGILLALALLPGAIAFSLIAGVSPTIGLLSTGLMMLVLSLTSNRTLMVSAPSSGVSLVVAPLMASYGMGAVVVATFIMGIIQIVFGWCHVNKLMNYIPTGVVIGFMNALGVLLFTSQLKNIFHISISTYMLTILSFILIWCAQRYITFIPAPLVAIVVLTICTWFMQPDIKYVHDMAILHFQLPKPSLPVGLLEVPLLLPALAYGLMMAIVAIVQTTLTARMMDDVTQSHSDKNRETIGQGMANMIVSLFGGYGGSALVGQSRFNVTMGATTRISTLVTGAFLIISLFLFGDIIGQIPMAVLATVLITISLKTFDRNTMSFIRKAPVKNDLIVLLTMFIILITNNLAAGVVIVTIGYLVAKFFKK